MSASFAFIPRKVASKKNGAKVTHLPQPPETAASSPKGKERTTLGSVPHDVEPQRGQEAPQKQPVQASATEDDAILVWLALSDYTLWADGDLRRRMERDGAGNRGYISLNYLITHSPHLWPLQRFVGSSQTPLVKALRRYNPGIFDIQLIVTAAQSWFSREGTASSSTAAGAGGYEIRRADLSLSAFTKNDWIERTIYVEYVPPEYKSISGLVRFLNSILPEASSPDPCRRIQNVSLPAHHLDTSGRNPLFKGFAFVTFFTIEDTTHLLTAHPWNAPETPEHPKGDEKVVKTSFRTLKKADWETLREEYHIYRQTLVQAINEFQDGSRRTSTAPAQPSKAEDASERAGHAQVVEFPTSSELESWSQITLASPYPYGCLIFVKNLHTETNKTTLKTLFGRVLDPANPASPNAGLDYVDFLKGMDTCHLRLSTPDHAERLATHFEARPTVQTHGLDNEGDSRGNELKPIVMEIVTKTREQVYWEKVPEKIRRGAVEKAVRLSRGEPDADRKPPQKKRRTW